MNGPRGLSASRRCFLTYRLKLVCIPLKLSSLRTVYSRVQNGILFQVYRHVTGSTGEGRISLKATGDETGWYPAGIMSSFITLGIL